MNKQIHLCYYRLGVTRGGRDGGREGGREAGREGREGREEKERERGRKRKGERDEGRWVSKEDTPHKHTLTLGR